MPPKAKLKAPGAPKASAAAGATLKHLPELLRALLSNENESRNTAEATLKQLGKDHKGSYIAALLQHARADADASVRQLAAVVLKRRVLTHWSALPPDHQSEFKNVLLEGIVTEPVPVVRRSIADVVSKVAKATVPLGAWNELPEFLAQCSASPEEGHRVLSFVLFASLTETIVGTMTKHYATLGNLFTSGLGDSSLQVRVAALNAVLALAVNASGESKDETAILNSLVVPVLAVAKNALELGEEKDGALAFEVFDELVEQQPKALTGHIELVVAFCLEVASSQDLDASTRRRALDVLSFLARHKPKALTKAKIIPSLIKAMCPLCGEPKESELYGEDESDTSNNDTSTTEEELHVQTVAARLVDLLSLNAPSKYVLPEVLAFASSALGDQTDSKKRHAGVAVLGIVAEGCAEGLEVLLPVITPAIINALLDESTNVRSAAAFALGQLAEWVNGSIDLHNQVLPHVFAALQNERNPKCLERLMYVLDSWLERLEEDDIAPYVQPTLQIAYAAIDGEGTGHRTKEASLGAVASAAAAFGKGMLPHLPSLLPRLEKCLFSVEDTDLKSRARALEVLGMLISGNGGSQTMSEHIPAAMTAAAAGFDLEFTELREYGHGLFAETAEALGEGFAQYLPMCIAKATESIEQDDGVAYDSEDDDGDDGSRDSEDDDARGINYSVFSGVVEEKAAACRAVASYAHSCQASFLPHVQYFTETMSNMTDHMHDVVRAQAHAALARVAQCALNASPSVGTPGVPDPSPVFTVVDASLNATFRALTEDDDRDAVSAAMEAAAEVIKSVCERDGLNFSITGVSKTAANAPGVLRLHQQQHVAHLSEMCLAILEGSAVCQEDVHDDVDFGVEANDEDEESLEAELGVVVLEGCAELLPKLVAVAGANVGDSRTFDKHFKALSKRLHVTTPENQRSVSYATLVEMVKAAGVSSVISAMAPGALSGCVLELKNAQTTGLKRNCAYCAGVLFELYASVIDVGLKEQLIQALCELLSVDSQGKQSEKDPGVRDNAAGAVARVLCAPTGAVARDPRLAPLLLDSLLQSMPLTEDFEECAAVYGGAAEILQSLASEVPEVTGRIGAFVHAFARVAAVEASKASSSVASSKQIELTSPTRATLLQIAAALQHVQGSHPGAVEAAMGAMPEDQKRAILKLVA